MNPYKLRALAGACAAVALSASGIVAAADRSNMTATNNHPVTNVTRTATPPTTDRGDRRDEARGAAEDVAQAVHVVRRMEQADPALAGLLQQARGVLVVPKYGRAALGVGGRGGVGVLLVHNNDRWSDPAFYNFGAISAGLEAGAEGGSLVLVLNNQKAVDSFMQDNNWSLNAGAGLTIVNWSKKTLGSAGMGDVTVWSDTKGLFGGATISVTNIKFDRDQTAAYYGKSVTARDVTNGTLASTKADPPKQALANASNAAGGATDRTVGSASTRDDRPTAAPAMHEVAPGTPANTAPSATDRTTSHPMEAVPK